MTIAEEEEDETGICECLGTNFQDIYFNDGEPHFLFGGLGDGEELRYPADYGTSCRDWDDGREPFCADNEEDYCTASWCLVSADCEASDTTTSNLNPEVAYSYATCGDSADFPDNDE